MFHDNLELFRGPVRRDKGNHPVRKGQDADLISSGEGRMAELHRRLHGMIQLASALCVGPHQTPRIQKDHHDLVFLRLILLHNRAILPGRGLPVDLARIIPFNILSQGFKFPAFPPPTGRANPPVPADPPVGRKVLIAQRGQAGINLDLLCRRDPN